MSIEPGNLLVGPRMGGSLVVGQAQDSSAERTEVRGLSSNNSGQPFPSGGEPSCVPQTPAAPLGDAFDAAAARGFSRRRAQALAVFGAAATDLNAAVAGLDGSACGELLIALGEVQAKLTAAHAALLRRFDAADAHDADGYGSSSSWLAAKAGMTKKDARAAVRQMRQLSEPPAARRALAAGDITDSLAFAIAGWTRKLPAPDARRDRPDPAGGRRGRGVHRRPGHHRRLRDRDLARAAARPGRPRPGRPVRAAGHHVRRTPG